MRTLCGDQPCDREGKKEAYLSAQKNEMKAVTQETYADAGLRQAERMLLSLKESLSEKERPDVTISCRILRLQNSREDREKNC